MRTVRAGRRAAGPPAGNATGPRRPAAGRWARLLAGPWRVPYSTGTARRFGYALASVPVAAGALLAALVGQGAAAARWQAALAGRLPRGATRSSARTPAARHAGWRGTAHALLSAPVGLAAYAATAYLGWLAVINLAYPFRPYLGFRGPAGGDIWANDYTTSWGGPTLAGAWGLHAGVILLTVVPLLGWVIRGLTRIQASLAARLLDARVAPRGVVAPAPAPTPGARGGTRRRGRAVVLRSLVGFALVALFVALSLGAHALGIGDNILWLPRDARDGAALAVTLAPLALLPWAVRGRAPVPRRR